MPLRRRPRIRQASLDNRIFAPQRDPYARKDRRIEYQLYSQEYFSGADMHIYLGDIWVDEVTSLEFVLQEEVLPIYGYNSYTFDAVARGRRQVNGTFSINFTSVGYLQEVLKHADAIEYFVNSRTARNNLESYRERYKLDEILRLHGIESFEKVADLYEEALWSKNKNDNEYIKSPVEPYFETQKSFDIRIHYGPVEESNKMGRYDASKTQHKPNLTVDVINDVHIYSVQKSASTADQGAPIQEVYTFIARDLNGASITE